MFTSDPLSQKEALSPRAIQHLRTTSRWVRLFGVLGIISSIFSVIGIFGALSNLIDGGDDLPIVYTLLGIVVLFVLVLASFYISYVLYDYGAKTSRFAKTEEYLHLGKAFQRQLTYWRWVGILITVILAFYLLYFIFAIALAINHSGL